MHKKQEILTAAYTLFSQKGYGLSMSDISELVGIKTPSLYSHFTGKDEIVSITVETEIEKWYEALEAAFLGVKHLSCEQQLKNVYLFTVRYFQESERFKFWKNIFVIDNAKLNQRFRELFKAHIEVHIQHVRDVFIYGISKHELKENINISAGYLFLSMCQGVLDLLMLNSIYGFTIDSFAETTWQAYWDGIKAN